MSMTPFKSATYNSQSVNNLTQDEIDVLDGSIHGLAVANKVLVPDDNVDLSGIVNLTAHCVVANWSALGCSGWNQTASFAHRDLNNQSQFAMLHSAFGEVRINATNSQNISLCINDLIEHLQVRGSTGEVIIGVASEVPSPNALLHLHGDRGHGLSMYATHAIEVGAGTDITCKFGKAEIGFNGVNPAWASYGYVGKLTQTEYALMAGNSGNVKLNSSGTGNSISFRENDVPRMTLSGGDFGIGIDTPAEKLDVVGNVKVSGVIEAGLNTDIICKFGRVAIGYMHGAGDLAGFSHIDSNNTTDYALTQSSTGLTQINSTGGTGIEFSHDNNFIAMFKFGDFGLGTGAPAEKLDVVGNAKVSGTIEAGLDLDLTSKFGRAAIGSVGLVDWAGFSHIDTNNATSFAIAQNATGTTLVNAASGTALQFRINDVEKARVAADGNFGINNSVPDEILDVGGNIKASGTVRAAQDTNTLNYLGKAAVGDMGINDWAGFSHFDNANATDYGFAQKDTGTTIINTPLGKTIQFRINDVEQANIGVNGAIEAGLNLDTTCKFGKVALGSFAFNNWAGFAHIDNANSTDYALLQSDSGTTILNSTGPSGIVLKINDVEGARLAASGNFGIGTNAPTESLEVVGNILASGTITPSDDRLKHNEVNIITGLDIIRQLVPQTYDKTTEMRDADYNGVIDTEFRKESGFIAQEIAAISELNFCVGGGDYLDSSGNTVVKAFNLNYTNIFTYGIAGIKELDAIVSTQAITIAAQASALAAFEIRLAALET